MDPISVLRRAIRAVPAVKYALGVGGLIAVIALVGAFGISLRVALVGTIALLIAMAVLLLFASAAGMPGEKRSLPALVFTWFALVGFIAISTLMMTSVFFTYPLDLRFWLTQQATASFVPASPASAAVLASAIPSKPLPLGVTQIRENTQQSEIKIELTSTGITRSYFFSPEAELRTIADVVIDQLSLSEREALGGTRYYRFAWVLVDKTVDNEWKGQPEYERSYHRMVFRDKAGEVVTIGDYDWISDRGSLTIAKAALADGTTFHIFPVQIEEPQPLSPPR